MRDKISLKQIPLEFSLKTKQNTKKGYMETKPTYKKGKKVDDNPLMSASDFYLFRIYELVIISMIAQRLIVITVEFN